MPINKRSIFRPLSAECGSSEIIDILLRANAQVNETDWRDQTACHVAAAGGHCDILALLLAGQPNLAAVDMDGETAFDCAVGNDDNGRHCALMLLKAGAPLDVDKFARTPAMCRFAVTSTAAIRALLDRGLVLRKLRSLDHGRHTLLHVAATHCRDADVFDMLVNVCGIDLEARDREDFTCVHVAAEHDNVFALRWLLNAGASRSCAAGHCKDANRLCARSCASSLHWPSISATRCAAVVRNPAVCVRRHCAADSVSHLVEDCDHSQAFSSSQMNSITLTRTE
jgi:ankyrin repeat protein